MGGRYSKTSEILKEYKREYQNRIDEKNRVPQARWFKELSLNITKSINDNLENAWLVMNNEMVKSIGEVSNDFENQKKAFEFQKNEDSRQIERLEVENEELRK